MPSYRAFRQVKIRHIFIWNLEAISSNFSPVKFSGYTVVAIVATAILVVITQVGLQQENFSL